MSFYIAILLGALFVFINQQTLKSPVKTKGVSELGFHRVFGYIGTVCMVFAFALPVYTFILGDFSTTGLSIMTGLFLFIFGSGFLLFIWQKNHKVLYDDLYITVRNLIGKEKRFAWQDIKDFRANNLAGEYVLTLISGEKVTINQYLVGINDFLTKMKQSIGSSAT